jgi:hypothetical protein
VKIGSRYAIVFFRWIKNRLSKLQYQQKMRCKRRTIIDRNAREKKGIKNVLHGYAAEVDKITKKSLTARSHRFACKCAKLCMLSQRTNSFSSSYLRLRKFQEQNNIDNEWQCESRNVKVIKKTHIEPKLAKTYSFAQLFMRVVVRRNMCQGCLSSLPEVFIFSAIKTNVFVPVPQRGAVCVSHAYTHYAPAEHCSPPQQVLVKPFREFQILFRLLFAFSSGNSFFVPFYDFTIIRCAYIQIFIRRQSEGCHMCQWPQCVNRGAHGNQLQETPYRRSLN